MKVDNPASREQLGRLSKRLSSRIDEIEQKQATTGISTALSPVIDNTFTPVFTPSKNGTRVRVMLKFASFGNADDIKIVMVYRSEILSSNDFDQRRFHAFLADKIDFNAQAAQSITTQINQNFLLGKVVDVIRLVAISADGASFGQNPLNDADINYAGYPGNVVYSFTTPAAYASTSRPHLGNIIENKLDDTTKAFDAFLTVQIIAPYVSSANITGTATITSGNLTVVGAGTTFTSLVVGQGITINGETHIIASIADNTHLNTDFAFKQTLAGQTAAVGTLQTWDNIRTDATMQTGTAATRVVAKFQLTDDASARPVTKSYYFSDAEAGQTSIVYRVDGFTAARKYNWVSNSIVDNGERFPITPLTTQTFVAGGFGADTAGLPELTTPLWKYDSQPPYSANLPNVEFFITQPNPSIALDSIDSQRRLTGTGTLTYTSANATITGIGTAFLTEVAVGNVLVVGVYLAASYQRLTVTAVTNDTSITVSSDTLPTATQGGGGVAFKVGKFTDPNRLIRRTKFHPDTAATQRTLRFHLGQIKAKKLANQDFVVILTAQSGNQREDVDNFTTDSTGEVVSDTTAPVLPNTPVLIFKRGKLVAKMSMDGASQIATLKTVELLITDGTNSLNLDNLDSLVVASGLVYYQMAEAGTRQVITISKQQLQTIFGAIGQLKCRFRLTNIISSTESSYSALINSLDTQTDYSPRTGYNNEVWNGDFTFDNNVTSTVLGNWQQYAPSDGGFSTITTTTASARWDQSNHLYFWRVNDTTSTNKRFLIQNLFKTVVPSDYKSFSFFLSSDGSLTADVDVFLASLFSCTGTVAISSTVTPTKIIGTGTAFLTELRIGSEVGVNNEIHVIQSVTNDTEAIMTTSALSTASGLTLFTATPQSEVVSITGRTYNTTETYIEVTVQVKSDLYTTKDIYLCFRTPTTITSAAPFLRVGRVMQVSGRTSVQFARKVLYERNTSSTGLSAGSPTATENFSTVPTGGIGGDRQEPSGEPAAVGGYQAF